MENKYDLKKIFAQSECPGQEHLIMYVEGKLPPAETQELEHHLTDCGFCSDTVETIRTMGIPAFRLAVTRVNETIEKKALEAKENPATQDAKVIPLRSRSRNLRWMGIAASVGLLVVCAWFFTGGGQGDFEDLKPLARGVERPADRAGDQFSLNELLAKGDFLSVGIHYGTVGVADSAIYYLKDLQEIGSPDVAYANWFYGLALAEKSNYTEAIAAIQKAIDTDGFDHQRLGKKLIKAIKREMEKQSQD